LPLQQMGEYLLGRSRIVAVVTNTNRWVDPKLRKSLQQQKKQ
jgi:hypothetical protein